MAHAFTLVSIYIQKHLYSHYTVSQKKIPDMIDCNLKKDYQTLIVFGTNTADTNDHTSSHLTQRLLLHYLGK